MHKCVDDASSSVKSKCDTIINTDGRTVRPVLRLHTFNGSVVCPVAKIYVCIM